MQSNLNTSHRKYFNREVIQVGASKSVATERNKIV